MSNFPLPPLLRKILLVAGLLVLSAYAWLSISVYRAGADPENFQTSSGSSAWRIGPSGKELKKAADARMKLALEAVQNQEYDAYREHLLVAEDLLTRSLRAQPRQPYVLASLAAVQWELDPTFTNEGVAKYLAMVEEASIQASNAPVVQLRLGKLLLAMGRRGEAIPYLGRAAELKPTQTKDVADALLAQGYRTVELLDLLPATAGVLAGLGRYFRTAQDGTDSYLQACEALLEGPEEVTAQFLNWYSIVSRRVREHQRSYDVLTARLFAEDSELEAERLIGVARALSGLDRDEEAIIQARAAIILEPDKAQCRDGLGDVALAAEDFVLARNSYREGIGILARSGYGVHYRSVLYRKIGQVEEKRGYPDRAYDAYQFALELNPNEWFAKRRMKQMREAAGIKSEDGKDE